MKGAGMSERSDDGNGRGGGRMAIAGWVLTVVPAGFMLMSSSGKFLQPPPVVEGLSKFGWTSERLTALGVVEVACVVLLLIPRTAVLGAILVTGYLGGATATHAQAGEALLVAPVLFGVIIWLGLYLRDARVRALVPLRRV